MCNFDKKIWIKKALNDDLYGYVLVDAEPNNKHLLLDIPIVGTTPYNKGRVELEVQSMSNVNGL
jgi:hypothetical protein